MESTQTRHRFVAAPGPATSGDRDATNASHTTLTTVLFIATSVCAGVAGQLALKHGMTLLGEQTLSAAAFGSMIANMLTSPWVLLGLTCYVAGTFFWLMVLSRVDLSLAYPLLSTSYILVIATSWLLLGESVGILRVAGAATILAGVILVSRSRSRPVTDDDQSIATVKVE